MAERIQIADTPGIGESSPVRGPTPPRQPLLAAIRRSIPSLMSRRFAVAVASEAADLASETVRIAKGTSTVAPAAKDWRFADETWTTNPFYRRLMQLYLASADAVRRLPDHADLDWETTERARFATSVVADALSPTNTLLGNPAALRRAVETRGASVARGAGNAARDLRSGRRVPLRYTPGTLQLGRDIAASPGAIIHRSEVCELIQYTPSTERVRAAPVLIFPSHINKHYIVDLDPKRSFVQHGIKRGLQTFCLSWRDPSTAQAHWGLDTYVRAGLEAIDVIMEVTGAEHCHLVAVCSSAMTTAALLGYMAQTGDRRARTTSMGLATIDGLRQEPVDLFGWEWVLRASRRVRRGGIIDGGDLTLFFALRRTNDRLWPHWVNNYLLGQAPRSNAVAAWSDHDQNLPGALQDDYLTLYSTNALLRPNVATVLGESLDLSKVEADAYVVAGARDSTSPWKASFRATEAFGGQSEFVLSPAGHGQTLLPGSRNPYATYLVGGELGAGPEHWMATAEQRSGSWWGHWSRWITERSGEEVPAPKRLGSRKFRPGDPAPGRYVSEPPR